MTHQGIREVAWRLDRLAFCRDAGITLDPWQQEVMTDPSRRKIIVASRQSGKSTCVALLALWTAICKPDTFTLIFSPSLDQSIELFRKIAIFYSALGYGEEDAERMLRMGMELKNGSRIEARPGSERTSRGRTSDLLIIDEAARIEDDLYVALRPSLIVSKGALIMLSTPFGQRGVFYEAWITPEGWRKWHIPWWKCPRIDPKDIEVERKSMSPREFSQEYEVNFEESAGALFSPEIIDRAFTDEVPPLWGDFCTPGDEVFATHQVLYAGTEREEVIPTAELLGMRAPVRKPDEIRADLDRALAGNPTYIKRRTALLAELDQALAKEEAESRHGRN